MRCFRRLVFFSMKNGLVFKQKEIQGRVETYEEDSAPPYCDFFSGIWESDVGRVGCGAF